MRILLSGGIKTHNLTEGLSKKFTPSGDDFVEVQFIDDIMNIFSLGDYFDKALITEQSITRDNEITDEMEIRQRINRFAIEISKKSHRYNFVFLASNEDMAQMIYDEILPIFNDSAVVLKAPPYKTTFFIDILVTEAKDLSSELVFEPKIDVPISSSNIDELDFDNSAFEDMGDFSENEEFKPLPTDGGFDNSISNDDNISDGFDDITEVNIDEFTGSNSIPSESESEHSIENEGSTSENNIGAVDIENNFEDISDDNMVENSTHVNNVVEEPDINVTASNNMDEFVDTDNFSAIEQSGTLPDYEEQIQNNEQNFIPGFDDIDEINKDTANNEIEQQIEECAPEENDTNSNEDLDGFDGFGTSMYNDENEFNTSMNYDTNTINQSQDNNDGFSDSMYSNNEDEYHDNVNNGIYEEVPQGFDTEVYNQSDDAFSDNSDVDISLGGTPNTSAIADGINNQKKKILNIFKGNNAQNSEENIEHMNTDMGPQTNQTYKGRVNVKAIKEALKPFASRGNSIVVTGCGGCGTSFIAYSLANIISQLGYTVLLVDMDTQGRTQSYITRSNYESIEVEDASLISAVNSSKSSDAYEAIVKQGFHLLTMGMGADAASVKDILHKEKLSRFVNVSKNTHNFVIYDIPFADATNFLADITYTADNLVLAIDASNWGIAKTMLSVCNISIEDMQETVFNRAQLVFNRYRNLRKLFGRKVNKGTDITKVMDSKVQELIGEDPGFHFEDMSIAGIINDDASIEEGWFDNISYTDTKKGQEIFLNLVEHIILKK